MTPEQLSLELTKQACLMKMAIWNPFRRGAALGRRFVMPKSMLEQPWYHAFDTTAAFGVKRPSQLKGKRVRDIFGSGMEEKGENVYLSKKLTKRTLADLMYEQSPKMKSRIPAGTEQARKLLSSDITSYKAVKPPKPLTPKQIAQQGRAKGPLAQTATEKTVQDEAKAQAQRGQRISPWWMLPAAGGAFALGSGLGQGGGGNRSIFGVS